MAAKLKPLAEQVIVLTGASSALGLCTAQLAAQQGARLVLIASSTRVLETLVGIIASSGGDAICIAADTAVRVQLAAAAHVAAQRFGRIDTWVNNGCASIYGRLDRMSETDCRRLFEVNFWGVVNGSLVALPYLLGGGALINVGSELLDGESPLQGMYQSSKHAVKGFTEALRAEVVELDRAPVAIALIEPAEDDIFDRSGRAHATPMQDQAAAPAFDPMLVAAAILEAASEGASELKLPQRAWSGAGPGMAAMLPAGSAAAKHAP